MRNEVFTFILVGLLALVQAALVTALPLPVSVICLPLIVVSASALNLRPKTAAATALLSGVIIDLLSSSFFGVYALSALLAVAITSVLLFRVLTHHTITAVVGVNASVFVLFQLLAFLMNSSLRFLSSGPLFHPAAVYALLMVLAALPIQLFLAVGLRLILVGIRGYTNRFILVN